MNSIARTTIFEPGDIVRVPFPHVERSVVVSRPALVIGVSPLGPDGLLTWTLMITNAARDPWPGDVLIPDPTTIGLIIPSKVRTAKIAAVETAAAKRIGVLDPLTLEKVAVLLRTYLFQ